jgi:hypothetical protein
MIIYSQLTRLEGCSPHHEAVIEPYAGITNNKSLAAEPIILDNHPSMPSSYNHPPQESLVQHFPTAHIDDFEYKVNQLMAASHAYTQPSHTHASH